VFRSAQLGSVPLGYPPHIVTRMGFVALSAYAIHQRPALIQTAAEDKTRTTNKGEFRP